ncbi:hypothetical protein OG455_15005 [Kitasatospora sp. NBC_01287]|uniref:hypothetical protein n=1 Tax=Kitasatospora sp. NBC_01287 TaxID=2903573 RepID=UPI00225B67B1|nr:hypothetical protein [Kitasatospora sp. NBC_01287]MCX4746815.1 hypothetical protein [Kitasatospora sp. NBC_01287]
MSGNSPLTRELAQARQDAADALDDFLATLALAGVVLPSVGVDWRMGQATGRFLIDLGAARPDVVGKLTDVLRKGLTADA